MRDELHQNYGAMTGTPTLVAGALTDGTQGLAFDGSTNSMSVPDSASDSLAVVTGGMALECFLKFSAFPGSTQNVIVKSSSYALAITAAGKLTWTLANGASSVTVTSTTTLQTGQWYHVVGVFDGGYTGTPQFGYTTPGTLQLSMPPDYRAGAPTGENNLQICKYTILEKGRLTSVVMDLQRYYDSTGPEYVAAVVYADSAGAPGALLAQSQPQFLSSGTRAWVTFPVDCTVFAGDVWLGFVDGEIASSDTTSMRIGYESSGGTRRARNALVTDGGTFVLAGASPNPFGTAALSDSAKFSIYANYTPTGRTGSEGRSLIYINGVSDASSAYTAGIADSANNIVFAPSVAVSIDEVSIWNRKLTDRQIAAHYDAR